MLTIQRFLALAFDGRCFESELYGDCREIVGCPHSLIGNRTEPLQCPRGVPMISDGALVVSLRLPYVFCHNKSCSDRTIIAGSLYGAYTTCLQATVLRFLKKKCKCADYYKFCYYKFVEAMEIVGPS